MRRAHYTLLSEGCRSYMVCRGVHALLRSHISLSNLISFIRHRLSLPPDLAHLKAVAWSSWLTSSQLSTTRSSRKRGVRLNACARVDPSDPFALLKIGTGFAHTAAPGSGG
jgi:hypothetical protein